MNYDPNECKDCGRKHNRALDDCTMPVAPFYVLSNDRFFSDWDRVNPGLTNTPVVPCDTYQEALSVVAYVESRRDQKRIRIVSDKPRRRPGRVLNLVLAWRDNAREGWRHNG